MTVPSSNEPVLIIGAGISGLLLAQYFRQQGVKFRIFERDTDLTTRGVGWGLTLHWSLPDLRALLPDDLVRELPSAYVDRLAVEKGASTSFPFFDLSTGELKFATPKAPESLRIRVTRERLRRILATGIGIEWGKRFQGLEQNDDSITATFEDGSEASGRLLIACDGAGSRVRRAVFPNESDVHSIPIRLLGLKMHLSPEQMEPIKKLDPFFLQGTSSQTNTFIYLSVLDAPGNNEESTDKYSCQMCVSWPYRKDFLGRSSPLEVPETNEEKHGLIQNFAENWAEPFKTIARNIPHHEEIKHLEPHDFAPRIGLRSSRRAILMGDALHAMSMYRGEGANHAIADVSDFAEYLGPYLAGGQGFGVLRRALDEYEDAVIKRARPGVLASRQACLDAHDWTRINPKSPLLTRREKNLEWMEE